MRALFICSPGHDGLWAAAGAVHGHHEEEHGGVRGAAGQSLWVKGSKVKFWSYQYENQIFLAIVLNYLKKLQYGGKQLIDKAWYKTTSKFETNLYLLVAGKDNQLLRCEWRKSKRRRQNLKSDLCELVKNYTSRAGSQVKDCCHCYLKAASLRGNT